MKRALVIASLVLACAKGEPMSAEALAPFLLSNPDGHGWRLVLPTGETPVDSVVQELGHEPNGPFWEGIAETVMRSRRSVLARCEFNSEAGAFVAYASDRSTLDELARAMRPAVVDARRLRETMEEAKAAGIEFDD